MGETVSKERDGPPTTPEQRNSRSLTKKERDKKIQSIMRSSSRLTVVIKKDPEKEKDEDKILESPRSPRSDVEEAPTPIEDLKGYAKKKKQVYAYRDSLDQNNGDSGSYMIELDEKLEDDDFNPYIDGYTSPELNRRHNNDSRSNGQLKESDTIRLMDEDTLLELLDEFQRLTKDEQIQWVCSLAQIYPGMAKELKKSIDPIVQDHNASVIERASTNEEKWNWNVQYQSLIEKIHICLLYTSPSPRDA
eukprot:TRINITY_DN12524_c0_g1_i1.p1 TRINITY_DN12524_c0_g1~~TRINITY_DN12524_c0_g1_i1.p1  ORF type:complete len:260 (-),score=60.81 TRINITY_DN12524_c0_g1_i1:6-749(-)